jgi:hypothetical protein
LTTEQAQALATRIASRFAVFDCDLCVRAIARALGRTFPATFELLRPADASSVIFHLEKDLQIATNGFHIGIDIAGVVFDNLHSHGVGPNEWPKLFSTATRAAMLQWSKPIGEFFGKVFLVKKFNRWLLGKYP